MLNEHMLNVIDCESERIEFHGDFTDRWKFVTETYS